MNKRILSLLLAIVMVLGVCAAGFTAFAAEGDEPAYEIIDSEVHKVLETGEFVDHDFSSGEKANTCICGASLRFAQKTTEERTPDIYCHDRVVSGDLSVFTVEEYHNFGADNRCIDCGYKHDCDRAGHPYIYTVIDANTHKAKCNCCGVEAIFNHKMAIGYGTDAVFHWVYCEHCKYVPQKEKHVDVDENYTDEYGNKKPDGLCDICGYELEHRYKKSKNTPATCLETGVNTYKCMNCSDEYEEEEPALGHDWDVTDESPFVVTDWDVDGKVQCVVTLYCTRGCVDSDGHKIFLRYTANDGSGYNGNIAEKLSETAPTCDKDGQKVFKATFNVPDIGTANWHGLTPGANGTTFVFEKTNVVKVDALGHNKEYVSEKAPTCTEDGEIEYKCVREGCGKTVTEKGAPALGHEFKNYIYNEDATCTADGTETAKCERCDATDTRQKAGTMLDHKPVKVEAKAPTCKEEGYTAGTVCETCRKPLSDSQPIPATGHTVIYKIVEQATCENNAVREGTCSVCGEKIREEVENSTIPHIIDPSKTEIDILKYKTCTEAGEAQVTTYCKTCGNYIGTENVTIPASHNFVDNECADCGKVYVCGKDGSHIRKTDVYGEDILYADEMTHYYECLICKACIYPDTNGTDVQVSIGIDGSVNPSTARHSDTEVLEKADEINTVRKCMDCGHVDCGHVHEYIKKDNEEAKCENFPFDIYRCVGCAHELVIKTGKELGHYWPVEVDKNGKPVMVMDEDVKSEEIKFISSYYTASWNGSHDSCTVTIKCMRPECEETISYTIYKKETKLGQIKAITSSGSNVKCKDVDTLYIAEFNFTDIPEGYAGEPLKYYVVDKTTRYASESHKGGSFVAHREPTCTESGYDEYKCSACGDTYKKSIPALGHNYEDGKCSRCGTKRDTLCNGNHKDKKYDIDFDLVCDVCGDKIDFKSNALHYIVGIPQFWLRVVIRLISGGSIDNMFITRGK